MKIDGKQIASEIKSDLEEKIAKLKSRNIIPHLAVVLIGNDPSSEVYVRQKLKVGEEIGVKVSLEVGPRTRSDLVRKANKLNRDPSVHGIIIQRPVPINISSEELDNLVTPQKDVDGFHPKSPFTPPIASAIIKILEYVYKSQMHAIAAICDRHKFIEWLRKQKILVIGRGETAGKPIAETLIKIGVNPTIAYSKTTNLKELCLASDIVISCVGKGPILRHSEGRPQKGSYIVRRNMVSENTLLIGVGLHQENGKLATDYDQEEIAGKVAFYTPVPGGVGPVNVACLFENLVFSLKLPR